MKKIRVLYITRNGLLDPLGQSQVFSYLKDLSKDYAITLITFEKSKDLRDIEAFNRATVACDFYGICWLPQRFHQNPRFVAPAWDMLGFLFLCLREVWKGNILLIHARSYIPAAVALLVNYLTRTPFIFDMRALWPEELIAAGRLQRGTLMHKAIVWVERTCLRRAAAVVSLTHAAVEYLEQQYPAELASQHLVVIPTCADLERFVPVEKRPGQQQVYACMGSVLTGWFKLDWLAAVYKALAVRDPDARFEVVTRDDPDQVRAAMWQDADFQSRLSIFSAPSHKMHEIVQRHSASAMFFTAGVSKLGSSPTRMGEVLGCGLPVIANRDVGDVAKIVEKYRVGVLLADSSDASIESALYELETLMADPELAFRCRKAAEEVFSLASGTSVYRETYERIAARGAT